MPNPPRRAFPRLTRHGTARCRLRIEVILIVIALSIEGLELLLSIAAVSPQNKIDYLGWRRERASEERGVWEGVYMGGGAECSGSRKLVHRVSSFCLIQIQPVHALFGLNAIWASLVWGR